MVKILITYHGNAIISIEATSHCSHKPWNCVIMRMSWFKRQSRIFPSWHFKVNTSCCSPLKPLAQCVLAIAIFCRRCLLWHVCKFAVAVLLFSEENSSMKLYAISLLLISQCLHKADNFFVILTHLYDYLIMKDNDFRLKLVLFQNTWHKMVISRSISKWHPCFCLSYLPS